MRRAQAATEFIMTYGWAILVVLVVMSALAAIGIWSPTSTAPDSCEADLPFSCFEYTANEDGVYVSLRYSGSETLAYTRIDVDGCLPINSSVSVESTNVIGGYLSCAGLNVKSRYKGKFSITYSAVEGVLNRTANGKMNVIVRDGNAPTSGACALGVLCIRAG